MTKFRTMSNSEFLKFCTISPLSGGATAELYSRFAEIVMSEEDALAEAQAAKERKKFADIEEAQMDLRDAERRLERLQAL